MSRILAFALLALFWVGAAVAAPLGYRLDTANSRVGFQVPFGPDRIDGAFPVLQSAVTIDFQQVGNSRVSVDLDVAHAQANFPFATQAMTGPKVLDARRYPTMRFVSTGVRQLGGGGLKAEIAGNITIRDVTRPLVLQAEVFRPRGTPEGTRDHLSVHLTGAVSRASFGADGWSEMVGDTVTLDMVLRIDLEG